ncbi:hypothetical protein LPJ62_004066 [Coemansia sp. RSA 2167]|nr:hypothetical protein LPJ58_000800 [Coemansia sp. RSA 1591]KAJ1774635.1 hypothetical protein LPJ54_004175 [Coemansia sp. RSA 1824]KAJ1785794.1 hypothetical protein LPJ62_004066 [Coemansia sp. RSA 2167]KAJ2272805.1 hypothetical protein EV176_003538 [Coemansia sp. RSA 451]
MISDIEKLLGQIRSESGRSVAAAGVSTESSASIEPDASIHTGIEAIDQTLPRKHKTRRVIELAGVSGSGKTHTLHRICATWAQASHVLYIDMDGTLDLHLLAHLAGAQSLHRIHVFRPLRTVELVATLAMLPKYAHEHGIHNAMVIVDSVGSHMGDRRELSHMKLKVKRATPWFRQQQLVVDTLAASCNAMDSVCVVAHTLRQMARDKHVRVFRASGTDYHDAMIPRWQSLVLQSFVLEARVEAQGTRIDYMRGPEGTYASEPGTDIAHSPHVFIGPHGLAGSSI